MAYSASALRTDFNDFLFASIGPDRNDVPLSVLSALARLGLDPWEEAAELAQLPRETAARRLASSIAALPDGVPPNLEHGTIAAHLIARLPSRTGAAIASGGTLPDGDDVTKFRAGVWMYVILMLVMFGAQWIAASRQPQIRADDTRAAVSDTFIPQKPDSAD
jgi:hypothetical protein